jgi:hypothetical protein
MWTERKRTPILTDYGSFREYERMKETTNTVPSILLKTHYTIPYHQVHNIKVALKTIKDMKSSTVVRFAPQYARVYIYILH